MVVQEKGGVGTFGNIVTIVVFILIITIALWGAISAVRLAPRIFSSVSETITGSRPIEVAIPSAEVKSGEPFTLTWEDRSRNEGLYTIVYGCTPNFEMRATDGAAASPFPCNMPFAVPVTETSARFVPMLKSEDMVSVPITIAYITPEGAQKTEGKTSLTVLEGATRPVAVATTTPSAPTTQRPTTPTGGTIQPPAKPAGKPDLVIKSIATGVIDPVTGAFIPKNVFGGYETVSYKFDIANRGTGSSGPWSFSATIPTRMPTPYQSPVQNPLGVGDHIEFTLNWSAPASGSVYIQVDPSSAVAETNEGNNVLNEYISVAY